MNGTEATYSLAFFLGPGFALGFGMESGPEAALLFAPGFGPGMPFLFASSASGCEDGAVPGPGVELLSDALSFDDAEGTGGTGVDVEDDDELGLESFRDDDLGANWASEADGRCSLTILLGFGAFEALSDASDEEVACTEFLVAMASYM